MPQRLNAQTSQDQFKRWHVFFYGVSVMTFRLGNILKLKRRRFEYSEYNDCMILDRSALSRVSQRAEELRQRRAKGQASIFTAWTPYAKGLW